MMYSNPYPLVKSDVFTPPTTPHESAKVGINVYVVESGKTKSNCLIEEPSNNGKMKLFVEFMGQCSPSPYLYLKDKFFVILENQQLADGIIWECVSDKCYRLHLFELKKTMTNSNWNEAKKQYHGTLLRCQIVADLLGVKFRPCIHLYTVYHQEDNTNFSTTNIPADELPNEGEQDWYHNRYSLNPQFWLPNWAGWSFHHHKVHLSKLNDNNIPEGTYDLQ
ncbi:MAG: hypothetical protein FWD31_00765 [Planctomycetaceae bacterium]|nr:hypothetical protein [Planctomycetaceae bacterium]